MGKLYSVAKGDILVEIDLKTVEDEAMKQILKQTAEKIGHNKSDADDGK